jgi:hypothetical protein
MTRPGLAIGTLLAAGLVLLPASPTDAQLRPYEPIDWSLVDGEADLYLAAGLTMLDGQRAALAGTSGRLLEFGDFQLLLRSGRVILEAAGSLYRLLDEDEIFGPPHSLAEARPLGTRRDVGDFVVSTTVLLSPPDRPATAMFRFGTRLPTTDDRVGLERDRTDFFALLGGRIDQRRLRYTAEVGIGIHGTHNLEFEQADVLVYLLGLTLDAPYVRPSLLFLGQHNGLAGWRLRGNEDLAELRLRLRAGNDRWLQLEAVRGVTSYSPSRGARVTVGATF